MATDTQGKPGQDVAQKRVILAVSLELDDDAIGQGSRAAQIGLVRTALIKSAQPGIDGQSDVPVNRLIVDSLIVVDEHGLEKMGQPEVSLSIGCCSNRLAQRDPGLLVKIQKTGLRLVQCQRANLFPAYHALFTFELQLGLPDWIF